MTRHYQPAGELLATALAGRIDAIERDAARTDAELSGLRRGFGDLTDQIRRLADTTPGPGSGSGSGWSDGAPPDSRDHDGDGGDDPDEDGEDGEAGKDGQRDWFAVTDPDEAVDILTGLTAWVREVGERHGVSLPVACWAVHADVVADLLALSAERDNAYTGPAPTPVSEWLTRWLPAAAARISAALAGCVAERGHRQDGRTWDITGFDALSAGTWWALDRDTPAPTAFALTPL